MNSNIIMSPANYKLVTVILLIAAVLLFGFQAWHWRSFTHDDAWISFRYAENLVKGNGLVFNPGERVEGYTNFLWTILMSGPIALGLDPVPASKILGVLFSLGTLLMMFKLSALLLPTPYPAAAVFLLAASPPFAFWSIGGLETAMFGFLTLTGLYLGYRLITIKSSPFITGLIMVLNMLTRPDGIVIWALFFLYYLIVFGKSRLRSLLYWVSPFVLIYIPYFLLRWTYYGWLLPNTYYVRMGTDMAQSLELAESGVNYIVNFFRVHGGLPAIVLFLTGAVAARFRAKWPLIILLVVWCAHLVHAGGDEKPFGRLVLPLLPLYLLFITAGIAFLSSRISLFPKSVTAFLLLVVISGFLLNGIRNMDDRDYVKRHIFNYCLKNRQIGEWIHANAKPGETMATRAIGALGFYGKIPCYDFLGIVDEHIAHLPLEPGQATAHGKSDLIHIIRKEPTYVVSMLMEPEKLGYRRLTIKPDETVSILIFKRDPSLIPDEAYLADPRENQGLLLPYTPEPRPKNKIEKSLESIE
ncbi:MAG: hypothetical protein WBM02_08025 [bacterium]